MNEEVLSAKFAAAEHARKRDNNDEAIRLYDEVMENSTGPLRQQASHMLGVSLSQSGDQGGANRVLAELLSEQLDDETRGNVLRDQGNALSKAKRYEEATKQLDHSLELLEKVDDKVGAAATRNFQARNLYRQGDLTEALTLAERARSQLEDLDAPEIKLYCDLFLAKLYAATHQPDKARALAKSAEKAAETYGGQTHIERAKLIEELADQPEELERRLAVEKI